MTIVAKFFADKVVNDDVLLPGDHVDLLILASPHPAVSVQPGKKLPMQLLQKI